MSACMNHTVTSIRDLPHLRPFCLHSSIAVLRKFSHLRGKQCLTISTNWKGFVVQTRAYDNAMYPSTSFSIEIIQFMYSRHTVLYEETSIVFMGNNWIEKSKATPWHINQSKTSHDNNIIKLQEKEKAIYNETHFTLAQCEKVM